MWRSVEKWKVPLDIPDVLEKARRPVPDGEMALRRALVMHTESKMKNRFC